MFQVKKSKLNKKLAEALGRLAEGILTKQVPYKEIPVQPEATSYIYMKFLQYNDEIDEDLRNRIIEEEVAYAKYEFMDNLVGVDKSFAELYPQHMETKKAFSKWVKNKEGFYINGFFSATSQTLNKKIPVNNIIKNCIQESNPDFSYAKNAFPGLISFSKAFLENNKIYIVVDKGTKRNFLSFFVGLENPKACFDIANFFGDVQSKYKYQSLEEIETKIKKALDLLGVLLPHFEKALSEVIAISGTSLEL